MATSQEEKEEEVTPPQPGSLLTSWRLRTTLICTLGGVVLMIARAQTSFAILCMARDDVSGNQSQTSNGTTLRPSAAEAEASYEGEFVWDKPFQGLVLSAYFYGYVATLIPAGWLTDRYRNHRVLVISALSQAALLALMPPLTRLHRSSLIALRILQGAAASVFFPAFNVIIRNWSRAGEFPLLFGLAWSGTYLGSAAVFPLSSALCQAHWVGGWTSIYYGSGLGLAAWALLACFVLNETPQHMRFISEAEKICLTTQNDEHKPKEERVKPVPLLTLLSNIQVWIISLSYFVVAWFFAAMNITLPTFMKEGFGFDIKQNGFLSALPSLCMFVRRSRREDVLLSAHSQRHLQNKRQKNHVDGCSAVAFMLHGGADPSACQSADSWRAAIFYRCGSLLFSHKCRSGVGRRRHRSPVHRHHLRHRRLLRQHARLPGAAHRRRHDTQWDAAGVVLVLQHHCGADGAPGGADRHPLEI